MCSLLFSWCSVLTPKRRAFPSLIWPKRDVFLDRNPLKEFEGWQRTVYVVVNSFLIPWSLLKTIRYSVSKAK